MSLKARRENINNSIDDVRVVELQNPVEDPHVSIHNSCSYLLKYSSETTSLLSYRVSFKKLESSYDNFI